MLIEVRVMLQFDIDDLFNDYLYIHNFYHLYYIYIGIQNNKK